MAKIVKQPSRASIRRSLSTLKKADVIIEVDIETEPNDALIFLRVDKDLLSPKKSLRKRSLKVKKVESTCICGIKTSKACLMFCERMAF